MRQILKSRTDACRIRRIASEITALRYSLDRLKSSKINDVEQQGSPQRNC